jgi:phosphoglycerate dehydrogenase-like enzyme
MNRAERPVVFCAVGGALERLRAEFPDVRVIDITEAVPSRLSGEILFGGRGQPSVEAMGRGVKWVQLVGTGIDNVAPEVLATDTVTVARGGSAVAISEYVLATMTAFARNFPHSWLGEAPSHWYDMSARPLAGSTLGLLGLGGIAQRVARLALAFDMSVRALRRSDQPSPVLGVEMVSSFSELASDAEHLVLAAPLTAETYHIVDAANLARVKRGVHLVNVARGGLVDQEALRAALDEDIVGRASLDVVDPEPLPTGHWLYTHPKVFLTPHSSWAGHQSTAVDIFCENLARYLRGDPLLHVVHDGY